MKSWKWIDDNVLEVDGIQYAYDYPKEDMDEFYRKYLNLEKYLGYKFVKSRRHLDEIIRLELRAMEDSGEIGFNDLGKPVSVYWNDLNNEEVE